MPASDQSDIQPYDSDHTALVHVLWSARDEGLSLSDADALASHIMRSKWMRAVRTHSRALVERRACDDGMCWAEPLTEACDHWKAEVERLRDLLRQVAADPYAQITIGLSEEIEAALDGT